MIEDQTIEIRRPLWRERFSEVFGGRSFARREVTFFLGTDEDIPQERRAAFAPHHVEELLDALREVGLRPTVLAFQGVGERAGFADEAYKVAGARVVARSAVPELAGVDVFHALKEPTAYEAEIPGPFLRLGALHLPSYPPGVGELLRRRNFSMIIDGATVGNCSYRLDAGLGDENRDRTPIVASMSRFAGAVAGHKVAKALADQPSGKVVVVGGGVAGLAAVDTVRPRTASLLVVEVHPPARERLVGILDRMNVGPYEIVPELNDDVLADAAGLIFAHRAGAKAAEKICSVDQLRAMRPRGAVADIAIDQGGSLYFEGYSEDDDAHTTRDKCRDLLNAAGHYYYAETNIPREVPYEATERHGDASWIYVATLLGLCGMHGGPAAAAAEILKRDIAIFHLGEDVGERDVLECLVQDLRNGVQIACDGDGVRVTDPDIERNGPLMQWIRSCAVPGTPPPR